MNFTTSKFAAPGGRPGAGRGSVPRPAAMWLTCLLLLAPAAVRAGAFVQIRTPSIVLTPTADDYVNDYVEATGAFGLELRAKNTGASGLTVLVRCSDPSPPIAIGDLLLRTATAPGSGGTTMATYAPVTAVEQTLWSTGVRQGPFADIFVDVRIRNLFNYGSDPLSTPTLTNTLIFTVVEP